MNNFNKEDEAIQAEWFEKNFQCKLTFVDNQRVGVARDYKIAVIDAGSLLPAEAINQHVELKWDYIARKTGNLYLETQQTFDYGTTYKPSGMVLAMQQSMFIVFSVRHYTQTSHYVFTAVQMQKIMNRNLRITRTSKGSNGNRPGCWTYGKLLPFLTVEEFKFTQLHEKCELGPKHNGRAPSMDVDPTP